MKSITECHRGTAKTFKTASNMVLHLPLATSMISFGEICYLQRGTLKLSQCMAHVRLIDAFHFRRKAAFTAGKQCVVFKKSEMRSSLG